jgi:glycosyltransferase 2 family protein
VRKVLLDISKFILFFGVGITILYLVYQNQNKAYQAQCALENIPAGQCSLLDKVFSDFQTVDLGILLLVMLLFNLSNVARALRWKIMLDSMGYRVKGTNAFFSVMLSYFANLGLPRIGEVIRATSFAKYEGIRIEKLMGTIVLDRLLDLISVLVIVFLALTLEFDLIAGFLKENTPDSFSFSGFPWLAVTIVLVIASLAIYMFRGIWTKWSIVGKIQRFLLGFWDGLQSIRSIRQPGLFILYSVGIWLMYFLMTYVCFFAFEPTRHLGLTAGLVVFVFGTFGVIIPSPGGMGTFHALAVIALSFYAIQGDDAFSFANILFFSIQIGGTILLGVISLILLPLTNRNYDSRHNQLVKEPNRIEV